MQQSTWAMASCWIARSTVAAARAPWDAVWGRARARHQRELRLCAARAPGSLAARCVSAAGRGSMHRLRRSCRRCNWSRRSCSRWRVTGRPLWIALRASSAASFRPRYSTRRRRTTSTRSRSSTTWTRKPSSSSRRERPRLRRCPRPCPRRTRGSKSSGTELARHSSPGPRPASCLASCPGSKPVTRRSQTTAPAPRPSRRRRRCHRRQPERSSTASRSTSSRPCWRASCLDLSRPPS
mmetsp:Transcript_9893/g.28351  ORF Transcript_9893/g.28351 Transcript_9893/m.28351 type:complete len:238 (-) Transcript_9893:876-1589(-)